MPTKILIPVKRVLLSGCCLSLLAGLSGCEVLNRDLFSQNTTSPAPDAETSPDPASPAESPAARAPGNASSQTAGKNVACDAPSYFAEVTWQDGSPRMTFREKPDTTTLDQVTPVAIVSNPDGSTTYGHQQDATTYVRIYPNGSCLVQAIDGQGVATAEEFGRVGFVE